MLQDERGNPHIVCRYRRSLPAQLPVHVCIVVRRLVIRVENGNSRLEKEPSQHRFVPRPLSPHRESGPQFSHHDEWQQNLVGQLRPFRSQRASAPAEVGVAIRVEGEPHIAATRHSTRRPAAGLTATSPRQQYPAQPVHVQRPGPFSSFRQYHSNRAGVLGHPPSRIREPRPRSPLR